MKKYILIFASLFCLNTVFSQKNIEISSSIEPEKTQYISVVLRGPSLDCPSVPLMLEVKYDAQTDIMNVVVRSHYEKPMKNKVELTHLWFPSSLSGTSFNEQMLREHFKQIYRSKLSLTSDMKSQLMEGFSPKPAFECKNGLILNLKESDVMMNLFDGKVVVLKIKVDNVKMPVVLKINSIITLTAKYDFPQFFNKVTLQYISDSYSISLGLPGSNCFGQRDLVSKFKNWNENLSKDYQHLLDLMIEKKDPAGTSKEVVMRKLELMNKYEPARKGVVETDCEELAKEYTTFYGFYNKIGEGLVTTDSLQRMISKMDELIDNITIAKNTGNISTCRKYKEIADQFNNVKIETNVYDSYPEMKKLAEKFVKTRNVLNDIRCGGITPPSGSCTIDVNRIKKATKQINSLLNEYSLKNVKNEQTFNNIVKSTDAYLNEFSSSCKNSKKYKTVIQQYQGAKNAYNATVK